MFSVILTYIRIGKDTSRPRFKSESTTILVADKLRGAPGLEKYKLHGPDARAAGYVRTMPENPRISDQLHRIHAWARSL